MKKGKTKSFREVAEIVWASREEYTLKNHIYSEDTILDSSSSFLADIS